MEDKEILALYWQRSEAAIAETQKRYESSCLRLASRLLCSQEDAKEVVNDALRGVWEAIPPAKPQSLGAFIYRITRNLACKRLEFQKAQKRAPQAQLCWEELAETIGNKEQEPFEEKELAESIRRFLLGLSRQNRTLFLRRYWYYESVGELARQFGFGESKVKSILFRLRGQLKEHLRKEGYTL